MKGSEIISKKLFFPAGNDICYGQDHGKHKGIPNGIEFTIQEILKHTERIRLTAPGYGGNPYGSGSIFVKANIIEGLLNKEPVKKDKSNQIVERSRTMKEFDSEEFGFNFEDVVKDKITDLTGTVVAKIVYLNGCRSVAVQPRGLQDGKPIQYQWIDVEQLELVTAAKPIVSSHSGGPMQTHQHRPLHRGKFTKVLERSWIATSPALEELNDGRKSRSRTF